jgi:predicted nucleotidyltransferase
MDSRIKNIGVILRTDSEGYIEAISTDSPIAPPWDEAVKFLGNKAENIISSNFHSFYVRGSVARGTAVVGFSDLDCLLLTKTTPTKKHLTQLGALSKSFIQKFDFITKLDINTKEVSMMISEKNPVGCFMVKVMAACVSGEDIRVRLPKIKPGPRAFVVRWKIKEKLAEYKAPSVSIRQVHLAKIILRAGMELVMEREQAFTRDLYPCYEMFSKYYPQYSEKMYQVLKLALFPTNKNTDLKFLEREIGPQVDRLLDELYPLKK